ncbi:MAG: hypothetical protein NZM35_12355 [Chitinophagales bacterium]|nr:hypothetical protein [Chitinophagales bacterium]MDW8420209.1 DUF6798 domain-containing protein [Chitinophagales bacterium]
MRKGVAHEYGFGWKNSDIIQICRLIDKEIPKHALFIQPFACTELKFHARASSYVDWKAFVRRQHVLLEWHRRIQLVYGISADDVQKGFALCQKADEYFYNLDANRAAILKNEGVTHVLTTNKNLTFGKLLFHNASYAVYQL